MKVKLVDSLVGCHLCLAVFEAYGSSFNFLACFKPEIQCMTVCFVENRDNDDE